MLATPGRSLTSWASEVFEVDAARRRLTPARQVQRHVAYFRQRPVRCCYRLPVRQQARPAPHHAGSTSDRLVWRIANSRHARRKSTIGAIATAISLAAVNFAFTAVCRMAQ